MSIGSGGMNIIPHPPIWLTEIRITDLIFLLCIGCVWEFCTRVFLLYISMKSTELRTMEYKKEQLYKDIIVMRNYGPSKFVETSKLERKLLILDKELHKIYNERQYTISQTKKVLQNNGNIQLYIIVLILYYAVPLITFDDIERSSTTAPNNNGQMTTLTNAEAYWSTILFPLSYISMGVHLSKVVFYGVSSSISSGRSVSALLVLWSSQVTMGKIMDAVDAYFLTTQ